MQRAKTNWGWSWASGRGHRSCKAISPVQIQHFLVFAHVPYALQRSTALGLQKCAHIGKESKKAKLHMLRLPSGPLKSCNCSCSFGMATCGARKLRLILLLRLRRAAIFLGLVFRALGMHTMHNSGHTHYLLGAEEASGRPVVGRSPMGFVWSLFCILQQWNVQQPIVRILCPIF